MVPATLAVGLLSGCCQVGCQAAVRCCQIVKHCQALSGAVSSCCQGCQAGAQDATRPRVSHDTEEPSGEIGVA